MSFAQEITLQFDSDGARVAWIADKPGTESDSAGKTLRNKIILPTAKGSIYVLDEKSGKLAILPVGQVTGSTWNIKASDFKFFHRIEVIAQDSDLNPVSAANLTLESKTGKSEVLLDPSTEGKATFYAIPFGDSRLTATYNSKGESKRKSELIEVLAASKTAVPSFTISLPGAAALQGSASADPVSDDAVKEPKQEEGETKNGSQESPAGDLVSYLFSFILLGGLAYFAFYYYKRNTKEVNAKLEQLGVQVPKAPDDPPVTPAVDPFVPKAPEPPQQIILSGSTPDPIAPVAVSVSGGEPRLTTSTGVVIQLSQGESIVGRDDSADLSFPGESSVSRRHAKIIRSGDQVEVEDLGSTNGTFVNGARIATATALRPGDQVHFGELTARFEA